MLKEAHKQITKILKVSPVKCVPVTRIAKGIAIAHINKCLLVRHKDHH